MDKKLDFGILRKNLTSSYGDMRGALNYLNKNGGRRSTQVTDLSTFVSGDQLDRYFANPDNQNTNVDTISNTLYATNRIYASMIDYLCSMYYWRYVTTPRRIKFPKKKEREEQVTQEYADIYHKMLEIVDGINIETTFPTILLNLFKNGQVYLYTCGHKDSKTVSTIILPKQFCRPTTLTQHGTQQIDFDLNFFNSIGVNSDQIVELLSLFPPEFAEKYLRYIDGDLSERWQHLDPRFSTCISMNESGFPTFLTVFYDLIDYKTYKINELERNSNYLERLVTQEIDLEKSGLDLTEVEALHNSMAPDICSNRGTRLVTTVGKIDVKQLQENVGVENKVLQDAYESLFKNGGFNMELFAGSSTEAINASIKRDMGYVWKFVDKIVAFYNLVLNNVYNFHDYQLSLRVLPLSQFNEERMMLSYHQNATFGVGLVDYVVAAGVKQIDIESTLEMDNYLQLSSKLVPLQSSHTQSSTGGRDEGNSKEEGAGKRSEQDIPTSKDIDKEKQTERVKEIKEVSESTTN